MMLRSYSSTYSSSSEGGSNSQRGPRPRRLPPPHYLEHVSFTPAGSDSSSMPRNTIPEEEEDVSKGSIRGKEHEWDRERVIEIQRIRSKARQLRSSRQEDDDESQQAYQSLRSASSTSSRQHNNNNSRGPFARSPRADQAERYLLQGFRSRRSSSKTEESSRVVSPQHSETTAESSNPSVNLTLHDLCGEAVSVDDVAWRNAIHVLSQHPEYGSITEPESGWTPLHICCLSNTPEFMFRGLLHVAPETCQWPDHGGRLALHVLAATTGDVQCMEWLVKTHETAISITDHHECTPLQLLLRNTAIVVTFRHVQVLLGMTYDVVDTANQQNPSVRVRKGDHLDLSLAELSSWRRSKPVVTNFLHHNDIDTLDYPNDVAVALRTLANWKAESIEVSSRMDYNVQDSPAAIPNQDGEFPIHIVIQRAFVDQAPLEVSQRHEVLDEEDEEDEENVATTTPSIQHATSIVRLLAAECPAALTARDTRGMTPLLHILSMPEVDTELVETLLGKRFPQFDQTSNAAMVAHPETRQLPLHIVAEEYASDYAMIQAVAEAHPFAKSVQDGRGRTPLHLALHSYRRIPADPRVLDLLYKDSIATVVDDYGNSPAHLLLQSRSLPKAESDIYQRIFAASSTTFELSELRKLPSWLRTEACATRAIQELIVKDLAQPWKTAFILFDGFLLVLLITVFRIQMKQYVDYLNTGEPIQPWYTFVVYASAMLRLISQVLLGMITSAIGEFRHLFGTNIWYWTGIVSTVFCMVTSAQMYGSANPQRLLSMGTASTCLLWISLLGYMATWFHGMAVFAGAFGKVAFCICALCSHTFTIQVARRLVFPLLTALALFIAFAQCFFTLLQLDCNDALGGPPVCTERDAYRVVYHLVRGVPISSPTEPLQLSNDAILLVAILMSILVTFGVALLVSLFVSSSSVNFEDIALASYWEPKLALVVAPEDFNLERSASKSRHGLISTKLGALWEAINEVSRRDTDGQTSWYVIPFTSSFDFVFAFFVVPFWCLLGFFTFGLLWPYQVREWLFRPDRTTCPKRSGTNQTGDQPSSLHEEITDLKHSFFERSSDLKKEIRQLKELLMMAVDDE